jgi:hypothetical protein
LLRLGRPGLFAERISAEKKSEPSAMIHVDLLEVLPSPRSIG